MKRSTVLLAIAMLAAAHDGRAADVRRGEIWPLGLGTLESVPSHYPSEDGSPGAGRLKPLAAALGVDFDVTRGGPPSAATRSMGNWLEAQIIRGDDVVAVPPKAISDFFASHDRQVNAARDLLLSAPIAWPLHVDRVTHAPLPNLRAHSTLTRILVARAVLRGSWDDLHAAWALQRGLTGRPELISQLIALTSTRIIAAAARKLPAPAPAWFNDVLRVDVRRNMIGALQWQAWDLSQEVNSKGDDDSSVRERLHDIVMKPFDQLYAGNYVVALRNAAVDLAASRQCAFDGRSFDDRIRSDLGFLRLVEGDGFIMNAGTMWQRVARFTAEREATAIVLALKAGQTPRLSSQCSDGAWRVTEEPSGAKHIRFSRDITVRRPQLAIPLEYTIR